jgi:hypothetical protein
MIAGKLFNEAIAILQQQGFEVRYEHLGGSGTGYCRVGSRQWVVVDVAQPVEEQLEQLAAAIASEPLPADTTLPAELRTLVQRSSVR